MRVGTGLCRCGWTIAVWIAALCGVTACEKEKDPQLPDGSGYEYFLRQTSKTSFTAELVKRLTGNDPVIGALLDQQPQQQIVVRSISYRTTDPRGNKIIASGAFFMPPDGVPVKGVVVAEHGTIIRNLEAPSLALFQPEGLFAFAEYAVIMPDLIGFGASHDWPHPYLHAESAARVTADMVFAVQEYIAAEDKPLGGPMYVMGYSQGGHSALAFQRLAEAEYSEKLPLKRVFAGAGPYDLAATFDELVRTDYTSFPGYVPYTVIGLDYGDDLKLDYTHVFREPLLSEYPDWFSGIYDFYAVNDLIGSTKVSDFMHPDLFSLTSELKPDVMKLRASLARNSLLDWTPSTPIRFFHGEDDTVVPLLNSENACAAFKAKGCDVELTTVAGDHTDVSIPFYLYVFNELKK